MERKYRLGFTLVELMVVIVIIGILAGIVAVKYTGQSDKVPPVRVRADFRMLEDAIDLYKLDTGQYPENLEDMFMQPVEVSGWRGPYLKGSYVPRDPWGTEYAYDNVEAIGADYLLKSAGPNREFDDEDDMSNVDPPDTGRNG